MSDKFVPLSFPGADLASTAPVSRRARVLSSRRGVADAPPMQPLMAEAAPVPVPKIAPVPHLAHGEPRVQVQRDGDKIIGIQIQCGCGQVIDLECKY